MQNNVSSLEYMRAEWSARFMGGVMASCKTAGVCKQVYDFKYTWFD